MRPHELLAVRKALGLTQAQLGAALKLGGTSSKSQAKPIHRYESGLCAIPGPVEVAVGMMMERVRGA